MKKLVVGMFALVMCAGMAMAATKSYTCAGYNKKCDNLVSSKGALCSVCNDKKIAGEYHQKQSQYCENETTTTVDKWKLFDCDNYNNSKSN